MRKDKKREKTSWITKQGSKGITNWGRFSALQVGAKEITNRGSFGDFKSGNKIINWGKEISNRGKMDFKWGQGLQIGAERYHRCLTKHLLQNIRNS